MSFPIGERVRVTTRAYTDEWYGRVGTVVSFRKSWNLYFVDFDDNRGTIARAAFHPDEITGILPENLNVYYNPEDPT